MAPNLRSSEEQSLVVDLIAVLSDAGFGSLPIIVVDEESPDVRDEAAVSEAFRAANTLFWRNFWIHGPEYIRLGQLAQLVYVLGPRMTIIGGTREVHEMVARFGAPWRRVQKCSASAPALPQAAPSPHPSHLAHLTLRRH